MAAGVVRYVIDTCAIGDLEGISASTALPVSEIERERIWRGLERLISEGRLVTVYAARAEIQRRCPSAFLRLKEHGTTFFVPDTAQLLIQVQSVLATWPEMAKRLQRAKANRDPADPYIIAMAHSQELTVVTRELHRRDRSKNNRSGDHIPDTCEKLNPSVRWRYLEDFINEEGL